MFSERVYNELRFRLMDMLFSDQVTDFEREYIRKVIDIVDRFQIKEFDK